MSRIKSEEILGRQTQALVFNDADEWLEMFATGLIL